MKLTEASCIIEQQPGGTVAPTRRKYMCTHTYIQVFIYGYTHLPFNVPMKRTRDIKWKQANILLALCVFNRCNLIKVCKEREGERE